MDQRNYDLAAEFSALVGTPHLLEYLGLGVDTAPEDARQKLKARRKYMQGMQSNPKYKQEALFLIKHFSALSEALGDPRSYLSEVQRRSESGHLPILEMTIKGVLAGGALTIDQEAFLRHNAIELGISARTFEQTLDRLAQAAGVVVPTRRPSPVGDTLLPDDADPPSAPTAPTAPVVQPAAAHLPDVRPLEPPRKPLAPEPEEQLDFYRVLGVSPYASREDIYLAWHQRQADARALPDPVQSEATLVQVQRAYAVLSNPQSRDHYDRMSGRTAAPARRREGAVTAAAATAPPVRPRQARPPAGARLEILGDPNRLLRVGRAPMLVTIGVRNGGEGAMPGTLTSDASWLVLVTTGLDPAAREQSIEVRIEPSKLKERVETGRVVVMTDSGDTATITFEVEQTGLPTVWIAALAATGIVLLIGAIVAFAFFGTTPKTALQLRIDPLGTTVRLGTQSYTGGGHIVTVEDPPTGMVDVTVESSNFKPWTQRVDIAPDRINVLEVRLDLAHPLDWVPGPDQRRVEVPRSSVGSQFDEVKPAIDACFTSLGEKGRVQILLRRDGRAAGLVIDETVGDPSALRPCVERQTAALFISPLKDGDYATMTYEFSGK